MNVRRYQARTMPEAMRQVREQLGPEAMILSSRRVNGMIEVVAAIEPGAKAPVSAPQTRRAPVAADPELAAMRRELKDLRALLAQQQVLSERDQWAVTHPLAASIVERLMDCGFGEKLSRSLVGSLQEDQAEEEAWARLRTRLAASIAVAQPTVLDRGGVLALVGPTGAGKTTTLCRLALRRIRRLGVESVTLATLDRQRIGAYRQLQTFGQMAGVPVILLDDERDLLALAKRAAPGHLILVDTEGRPARAMAECRPFAQIRSLIPLETWLVIPATHQASVLHQVLQSFQVCAPSALVLTKIDEAERLGEVLAVLLEQQLGLVFQSDGQGLEDDFQHADTERLVRLAFGEPDVPRPQQADRTRAIELPLPLGPGDARAESLPAQLPRQAPRSAPILNRLGSEQLVLESIVPFRKSMHAAY